MFQLNGINALFNCKLCQGVLEDPIILPCGETVCKAHTDEIKKGKCMSCSGAHLVPKQGFLENGLCQHEINKISLNLSRFKDYHEIIQDLNKNFKETDAI